MGKPIYITDPVVAAAYYVAPGEFASVPDDVEADWLIETHQGYPHEDTARALPAVGFVHPDAPQPFVPYAGAPIDPPPEGGDTRPSGTTIYIKKHPSDASFGVTFAGTVDAVVATGHFIVFASAGDTLADVTYEQPPGTNPTEAAALLAAALAPFATLQITLAGAVVGIRGADLVIVGAVEGDLTIPVAAGGRRTLRRSGRRAT
jgi:hypothetical protein